MLRRVDSRCEDACVVLGYPRGSVLAFTQGGVDVQQGQPGSAHTLPWRSSTSAGVPRLCDLPRERALCSTSHLIANS